jgi:hypothetical protein
MLSVAQLLREGRTREVWELGCGFLDLDLSGFMRLQRRMLMEQMELLKRCELGRRIMRGAEPRSIEEFREEVPLTTYQAYAPYLLEQREDVLPEPPLLWQRTSGRSGEYRFKWVPVTRRMYEEMGSAGLAMLLLSTCSQKGEVALAVGDRFLHGMAPRPYTSGTWAQRANDAGVFRFLPPLEKAEQMAFDQRVRRGFDQALGEGLDLFYGLSSVLVAVGEQFSQRAQRTSLRVLASRPRLLLRLARGLVRSKLAGRPLLPRDLWRLKGLVCAGIDAEVYRERVRQMWGRYPLHIYGTSESTLIALQTWDYNAMTFVPQFNFLEFLPEVEARKALVLPGYRPRTLLLDQVTPGERYEMVVTNFLGGPFVRYRLGDVVKITSLRNEKLGINLPQMVFHSRVDGVIDIAGFTRLTEKTVWEAMESSGILYEEWTVRREVGEAPRLHLYLEAKRNGPLTAPDVAMAVHRELKRLDGDYADLENMLGLNPLRVTLLPAGTFRRYRTHQQAAGADLVRLRPPHLNPSDEVLRSLLECAAQAELERLPQATEASRTAGR